MTTYVSDQIQATAASTSGNPPPVTSWQWLRNGAPIESAVASLYETTQADLGANIAVQQIATNLGGSASAVSSVLGPVLPFDPAALFRNNEEGAWYDPSDFDRYMAPLGPELVTNGDFSSGTTGWSGVNATLSQSSGACVITADGAGQARASQTISTVAGRWYEARATVARGTGAVGVDLLIAGIASSAVVSSTTPTDVVVRFAATGSTTTIRAGSTGTATAGTTYVVDNISVRELTAIDTATLFQDSAGTTPVTAVEQPVGLMLDMRKGPVLLTKGGELPGTASSNFTSPDSVAASITGDIDIRVKLRMNDWTPAASSLVLTKFTSSNLSYYFFVQTDGKLNFQTSANGTTQVGAVSTVATGVADGATKWLRVTRDVDNGASGNTTVFYVSDDGATWTQLGDAVTNVGATSIYDGTGTVNIGGDSSGTFWLAGKVYRAQVYNGINGTLAVDFDPTRYTSGATFTAATGEVWTINGSARITPDGNHAFQTTSTSRPVLSARYNLLTKTEQFDDAAWTKQANAAITANQEIAPDGTLTADLYTCTAVSPNGVYQSSSFGGAAAGNSFTLRIHLKYAGVGRWFRLMWYDGGGNQCRVWVDMQNGVLGVGSSAGTATYASSTLTAAANGWYVLSFVGTQPGSLGFFQINGVDGNGSVTAASASLYVWGADLRVTNDAAGQPAYQRVNTATDYDTAGFKPYLRFDGTDDWLQTNSINFTGTDKMTVFAGVRKLTNQTLATGASIMVELSADRSANNGVFTMALPLDGNNDTFGYAFANKGTLSQTTQVIAGYPAPRTNVLTGIGDISGDSAILRVNGSQVASNTADQGTGNYGNYPLYIGRRGGTTLPFNGRLYGLIVRGAATRASQTTETEGWLNQRTGAF